MQTFLLFSNIDIEEFFAIGAVAPSSPYKIKNEMYLKSLAKNDFVQI